MVTGGRSVKSIERPTRIDITFVQHTRPRSDRKTFARRVFPAPVLLVDFTLRAERKTTRVFISLSARERAIALVSE
jgi:hypothetical protein